MHQLPVTKTVAHRSAGHLRNSRTSEKTLCEGATTTMAHPVKPPSEMLMNSHLGCEGMSHHDRQELGPAMCAWSLECKQPWMPVSLDGTLGRPLHCRSPEWCGAGLPCG